MISAAFEGYVIKQVNCAIKSVIIYSGSLKLYRNNLMLRYANSYSNIHDKLSWFLSKSLIIKLHTAFPYFQLLPKWGSQISGRACLGYLYRAED